MAYNPQLVPSADSVNNVTTSDVVGNKSDTHAGTSLAARGDALYDHAHKESRVYPTLVDGVTITKVSTASWGLDANPTEIIPASTISADFDIHWIDLGAISANDSYEIILYKGANPGTEIARRSFDRSTTQNEGSIPCQTPIQAANTRISAKLTSSATSSRNVTVKLGYHTY